MVASYFKTGLENSKEKNSSFESQDLSSQSAESEPSEINEEPIYPINDN